MALSLLAGCSAYDWLFTRTPPPPCPRVSVLADASSLVKFQSGPGRDLTDIEFGGEIKGFETACEYDLDEDTGTGSVTVEVAVFILAERGLADRDRRAVLPYFALVLDAERRILNKRFFEVAVEFPGNRTRVTVKDDPPVALTIPLKAEDRGETYRVIVGFQLSKEELEYNRRQRASRR